MAHVVRLSISILLLVLVAPAFAEIHPELQLEVTVPDSVDLTGGTEARDVNGDGYSELLFLKANPIVAYSVREERVLDYFKYASDGLTRLYAAEYIDGDDRLDVAKAVLFPQGSTLTFAIILFHGAEAYISADTLYTKAGLNPSRDYSMDGLYFVDVNRDGQRELFARYYYVVEYWDDPWDTVPSLGYYYSSFCYDFAAGAIVSPTYWPPDGTPLYTSASDDGGIRAISTESDGYFVPASMGFGSRSDSGFTVFVTDSDGTPHDREFSSLVSCPGIFEPYNNHEYKASLRSAVAGDILPGTPGLELLLYVEHSFLVTGRFQWQCSGREGQLVLFNLLDPSNWTTIKNEMPCDTSIDQVFLDPRFKEAFLSLDDGLIKLRDASTYEIIDQSLSPINDTWAGYVTLEGGDPPVAAFRSGRTFRFYALTRTATDVAEPETVLPAGFSLDQPYPNPFNPSVTIPISIDHKGHLRVEVFNVLGQAVGVVYDGKAGPGEMSLVWDAKGVPSGVYFFRVVFDDLPKTVSAMLVK